MSSRNLVDPELYALLDSFPELELTGAQLEPTRAALLAIIAASTPPLSPEIDKREQFIPGPEGAPDVRVIIYEKSGQDGAARPAILHIHGGAFVLGNADMNEAKDAAYVDALGAVVVSVDYRLAPETPHPGPVEDCYAALCWMYREAEALGIDRDRIIVTGESAGGGLTAAVSLLARDRQEVPILLQHLIYPMLDDRAAAATDHPAHLGEFVFNQRASYSGWAALLGDEPGGVDVSSYAAPARAKDLSGLPPTFMVGAALDVLIEENMDYARRLVLAGVPTELHVYPAAPHGFDMASEAGVSRQMGRDSLAALARAIGD